MPKRVIINKLVTDCIQCPHYDGEWDSCWHPDVIIEQENEYQGRDIFNTDIPDWCPLPDEE